MDTTYPETLILDGGDDVTGQFERLERGHTRDGEERAIAIIAVEGVERSLWLHEAALRAQFKELRPEPGETVRIRKGAAKKHGVNGFDYWPCRVTAPDRPAETPDWDSPLLAGDGETQKQPPPPSDVPSDFDAPTSGYGQPPVKPDAKGGDDVPF